MGNTCSPDCLWWYLCWCLFVLSFFPVDILDEIWDVIEAVSEGFRTYSFTHILTRSNLYRFQCSGVINGFLSL